MPNIGRIIRVPLRDVWPHEAIDFTPWLRDNLDALNEILGITLIDAESEQPVGTFSVDLVAQTEEGARAVIENQLEKTDHDHLGKLITYLANIDEARIAIWITPWPRAEHITAINWLNEATDGDFYLVKLEAVRIGDSPPAPIMTLVVEPSEEVRTVKVEVNQTRSKAKEKHRRFWTQLLEESNKRLDLFKGVETTDKGHIVKPFDFYSFHYEAYGGSAYVLLSLHRNKDENTARFEQLKQHQQEVNEAYGKELEWYIDRWGYRVREKFSFGMKCVGDWSKLIDTLVDQMIRLHAALQPYIDQLD